MKARTALIVGAVALLATGMAQAKPGDRLRERIAERMAERMALEMTDVRQVGPDLRITARVAA